MVQFGSVVALAVWLVALATGHTFGGWIHLLPLLALLALAARFAYTLLTLD